ncbi:MAG: DnaB-like helicase N-terminal domain-containing protein [bacterium]
MSARLLKKDDKAIFSLAKTLPLQADESEKAVLAAMAANRKAWKRALTLLRSEQFFHPSNQQSFELLTQTRQGIAATEFVGGADRGEGAEERVKFHAVRVKDAYLRRKLLGIAMGIAHNAQCGMYETRELVHQARAALEALENRMTKETCVA